MRLRIIALCLLLPLGSCSSDDNPQRPGDGGTTTGDGPSGSDGTISGGLTFSTQSIDLEDAGHHTAIGAEGNRIGLAYYRATIHTVMCPPTGISTVPEEKDQPSWDLLYVESSDGGKTWSSPVDVDFSVKNIHGLSIVLSGGATHIGYLGGDLTNRVCESGDAMVASSTDGQNFTPQAIATDSITTNRGDAVGHWTSVAVDGSGQVQAAYRDVRFGIYEQAGQSRSSVVYSGEGVDLGNGAGRYNTLKFDDQGRPLIVHYNAFATDAAGGIQLAIKEGGEWQKQQLVPGSTSERPDFDTDGNGTWGLAYYEDTAEGLYYIESTDLSQWSAPIGIHLAADDAGKYSSLAYDANGNPAVAYYRCGPAVDDNCDFNKDAVMLAYRIGGSWKNFEVDGGGKWTCGIQTSLAFNADNQPVISYSCAIFNNNQNAAVSAVKVAVGAWE